MEVASRGCRLAVKFCNVASKLQEWFDSQQAREAHDTGKQEDSELIQPFRYLSLRKDDGAGPSRKQAPYSGQISAPTAQKQSAACSKAPGLGYPKNSGARMQGSDDFGPLNPLGIVSHNDESSSVTPTQTGTTPTPPPLTDYLSTDWASQYPDDSLPTFGLTFDDEFLDPVLDLDMYLSAMNSGGGGFLSCIPSEAVAPIPPMDPTGDRGDGVDGLGFL